MSKSGLSKLLRRTKERETNEHSHTGDWIHVFGVYYREYYSLWGKNKTFLMFLSWWKIWIWKLFHNPQRLVKKIHKKIDKCCVISKWPCSVLVAEEKMCVFCFSSALNRIYFHTCFIFKMKVVRGTLCCNDWRIFREKKNISPFGTLRFPSGENHDRDIMRKYVIKYRDIMRQSANCIDPPSLASLRTEMTGDGGPALWAPFLGGDHRSTVVNHNPEKSSPPKIKTRGSSRRMTARSPSSSAAAAGRRSVRRRTTSSGRRQHRPRRSHR